MKDGGSWSSSSHSVDLIHKTLYSYSNNNLNSLLSKNEAFRFLLNDCITHKERIFTAVFSSMTGEGDDEEDISETTFGDSSHRSQPTSGGTTTTNVRGERGRMNASKTSPEDIEKGL